MFLIPDSFLKDIFGNNKPGIGSVFVEKSRQDRTDDIKLAYYLKKKFGGDYTVLSDITPQGIKVPDLLLSGKALFENKNVTSLSSLDSQVRRALSQLDKDNLTKLHPKLGSNKLRHVLVVQINSDADLTYEVIINTISHRIERYRTTKTPYINYIMVRKNGRINYLWQPKKPHE